MIVYYAKLDQMENVIELLTENKVEFHLFSRPLTDIHGTPSQMKHSRFEDIEPPG